MERSGPLGFELLAGHIQFDKKSNLVPLGELKVGAFQQRSLLFKVRFSMENARPALYCSGYLTGVV